MTMPVEVQTSSLLFVGMIYIGSPLMFYLFIYLISVICLLQMAEYRVSIYGRKQSEWDQLASWIVNNDLYSENVVWLIQVSNRINYICVN